MAINTKSSPKKVIILQHNGGRLANQLWLFAHVYAYCLDQDRACEYPAFYEYAHYFPALRLPVFARGFQLLGVYLHPPRLILYGLYIVVTNSFIKQKTDYCLTTGKTAIFLPPSATRENSLHTNAVLADTTHRLLTLGWNFQNPVGIARFHNEICTQLRPAPSIMAPVTARIAALRQLYGRLVGVHIRQGDYRRFHGGEYAVDQAQVAQQLTTYVNRYPNQTVGFIICSDGPINQALFSHLAYTLGLDQPLCDLMLLSQCDEVIGSRSTFGAFAAYYGAIPFTIFGESAPEKNASVVL